MPWRASVLFVGRSLARSAIDIPGLPSERHACRARRSGMDDPNCCTEDPTSASLREADATNGFSALFRFARDLILSLKSDARVFRQ